MIGEEPSVETPCMQRAGVSGCEPSEREQGPASLDGECDDLHVV